METFDLLMESLEAPAVGFLRERQALKIWAALHGVVMLAEQGLLTGQVAQISREELVEEIVEQSKLALSVAIKAAGSRLESALSRHCEERSEKQSSLLAQAWSFGLSSVGASRRPRWLAMTTYFGALGSIGVLPLMPRISSSTLAPASSFASPRGAATICSPTGRPEAVKPHGSDSAGQHTSVIA